MRWVWLVLFLVVIAVPSAWFYRQKTLLDNVYTPEQVWVDAPQLKKFDAQVYDPDERLSRYLLDRSENTNKQEQQSNAPSLAELQAPSMLDRAQAAGTECFWLGHFYESRIPLKEQKLLPTEGLTSKIISEEKRLSEGWWIFVDGFYDRDDAMQYSEFLNLNGVSSFTEAAEGGQGYSVSLGLYAGKSQAQDEVDRLRKYGIDAQMAPRSRLYEVHGLRIFQDTTVSPKNAPWKQRLEKKYTRTFKKIAC